jgi:hypothetical protein
MNQQQQQQQQQQRKQQQQSSLFQPPHLQNNSKDEDDDNNSVDTSTSVRSTSTYDTLTTLDPSYYNRENVSKHHHKDHKGGGKDLDTDNGSTTRYL